MIHRSPFVAAAVVAGLLAPAGLLLADGPAKREDRPASDVRVRMKIRGKRKARVRVDVKVKNRGRLDQQDLDVVLHDGDPASPIWSETISLPAGKKKRFRLRLDRDEVGDLLTAECHTAHDDDEHPEDNEDSGSITPGTPSGSEAATRGRDLYVPLCSGCHGADGRGGTVDDENIAREDWEDFVEAFREGEDGMPRYPQLTSRDARDIVAYLRNPGAAGPPPSDPPPMDPPPADPPPTDPPPTTTPTYTNDVKPILDSRCVSCHGSGFAAAGIALHTYQTASANASASLASINAGRMPPGGSLSAADIATIRDWIAGGKPQ